MRDNPILNLIKIAAFCVLAFLVGLRFCQDTNWEDRAERLGERMSKVETSIERLNDGVSNLDRTIRRGGFRAASGTAAGGAADGERALPPPGQVDAIAWDPTPPAWLEGRAKDLWGAYGENFLKPDPDQPAYPSLDDPKLDPQGEVNLWYGSAPVDLNPLTLSDAGVTLYVRNYCNDYWAETHSQNPYLYKPALAYRVEVSPDYRTWVFWIRPGVSWHTPQVDLARYPHLKGDHYLTAQDWKFTIDLVMNPDVRAAHYRAYFQDYERCEVIDDHCFIMHWRKPSFTSISSNLNLLAPLPRFLYAYDESGHPFDAATLGSRFNEHWFGRAFKWVGTGAYYIERYDPEKGMAARRFDDYWGKLPAIAAIKREIFPSRDLHYTKFEAGEMTAASYLAPAWRKRVVGQAHYEDGAWGEHWTWSTGYSFIAYKNTHPFFRDVKVRHAMTHACNRERILQTINEGKGQIVTGPQSMHAPTYPKDIEPLAFDLERSRALLEEAGWADADGNGVLEREIDGTVTEFRVKAMVPDTAAFKTIFRIFREDLAKVGVHMELEILQWSQFSKRLDDRTFDVTALLWSTSGWDNDMTQIWHSKMIEDPESSNFIEFADSEVDRLIEKARETFDLEERVRIQSAAHRRIHDLQPYTFLNTVQLAQMYWKKGIADYSLGDRWHDRPFLRLWPLWVPSAGPR